MAKVDILISWIKVNYKLKLRDYLVNNFQEDHQIDP